MSGCADWAASEALPVAPVPLPANRLPDHNHGRGTCDQHLCPRSNGDRFLVWSEPGSSTHGPGATCGLVSGVMEPPEDSRFARSLLSRRDRRLAPSVRYPKEPWIRVHRRQQDREYPDHRTLICRESGTRLGAWSPPKTFASPADGEMSLVRPKTE